MVVVYRLALPSYLLARLAVRLKYFALPNILGNTGSVPELLQPRADAVHYAAKGLLTNADRRRKMREDLARVRTLMGEPGAATRIAQFIVLRSSLVRSTNNEEPVTKNELVDIGLNRVNLI
jgi:lipid-A-disaccharide synthase